MRIKTIFVLVLTVIITVIIMQNTDEVKFNILFGSYYFPKIVMLTGMSVAGFLLGFVVGRPRNKKYNIDEHHNELREEGKSNTLSDDDRDYIS